MATAANCENLTLGERIRQLRESGPHGRLSHDRLADALGTTRQTVIGWEKHGRVPNAEYRARLAEFFDVDESVFTDGELELRRLRSLDGRLTELERAHLVDHLEGLRVGLSELASALRDLSDRVTGLERSTAAHSQDRPRTGRGRGERGGG